MKNVKILLTFCRAYIRILGGKTAFPCTLKGNTCSQNIHYGEMEGGQVLFIFFNIALVLPRPKEEKVNANRKEEIWVL